MKRSPETRMRHDNEKKRISRKKDSLRTVLLRCERKEMLYETIITEQEKVIQAYSSMLHALLTELAQHRSVEEEEKKLAKLDEEGGLING